MSDLHDLLVCEAESIYPTMQPAFEALESRARRRRWLRVLSVAVTVVAVVLGTVVSTVVTRGGNGESSLVPAGPAGHIRPLITQGGCRGLTVTATLPGNPQRWPIQPGTQPNPIAMPPDALMWLRARGPCVDQLRISATSDLIQTATGGVIAFNKQGIGIIVSNGTAGHATIDLLLSRPIAQVGPINKIATIAVTITAVEPNKTQQPSPAAGRADFSVGYLPLGFHPVKGSGAGGPTPTEVSTLRFQTDGAASTRQSLSVDVLGGDAFSDVQTYANQNGHLRLTLLDGRVAAVGWNLPTHDGLHLAYIVIARGVAVEVVEQDGPAAQALSDSELLQVAASVQLSSPIN